MVDVLGNSQSAPGAEDPSMNVVDNQQEDEDMNAMETTMGHVQDMEHEEQPEMDDEASASMEETRQGHPTGVSEVVDMLFEIHSALKTRHLGKRTAASALAATNLVNTVTLQPDPISRDEQMEAFENVRKMLECAICQEVFSDATEAKCCGQVFCKGCIERWVSERSSCPMCRKSIDFSYLAQARHAQRMANEMKVTCAYCNIVVKKAALADHLSSCDKAPAEPAPPTDVILRNLMLATARLNTSNMTQFLLTPSPREAEVLQCYIRTRGGGNYELYTQDTNILICSAVRRRQYDMSVSFTIHAAGALGNSPQIARLEKNYMGSQYTMFNTQNEDAYELGAVQYAATFGKSPRQMRVALPLVREANNNTEDPLRWQMDMIRSSGKDNAMLAQIESPESQQAINLVNKPPVWIESLEAYCLDFGGRVAAASVKNFLLSHPDDMDNTLMLFGRTQDRQIYSMDYRHPFSPVQAFCIALSSMDSHLVTFD